MNFEGNLIVVLAKKREEKFHGFCSYEITDGINGSVK